MREERPGAIEVAGLERRFGERAALADVSFSVPAGRTLAVFGANGAGKTTLLRVLATLLRPGAGEVAIAGVRLPAESWLARGRIGYVAHEPLLYRDLSARENLTFCARLHGASLERVEELIAGVGMDGRADDPARELSRGMLQRVAVARALVGRPSVLLLDEPRAALDPAAERRLEALIGRGTGMTRVLVSHDVERALAESDLALGLRGGRVAFFEASEQLGRGEVEELYR